MPTRVAPATFDAKTPDQLDMNATRSSCFAVTPASTQSSLPPISLEMEAAAAATGSAPLVDMAEAELFELLREGVSGMRRLTPRTLEACAEEGIDPLELLPKALAEFVPKDLKVELSSRHLQARFERFEARRLAKVDDVIAARRRILQGPSSSSDSLRASPDMRRPTTSSGDDAKILESHRRQEAASAAAIARRVLRFEQQKDAAARTAAEAQHRADEVAQRMAAYEQQRAASRDAQMADAETKRELMVSRAKLRRAQVEAEANARATEKAAHEQQRRERFAAERKAQEAQRHEQSRAKAAKAEAARQSQAARLTQRKDQVDKSIAERKERMEAHAVKQHATQIQAVRRGISKAQKSERSLIEVDRQEEEHAEKIRAKIEHDESVSRATSLRETLLAQRHAAQAEHAKAVFSARAQNEKERDRSARTMLQESELKEMKRQMTLAQRAEQKADKDEDRLSRYEATLERIKQRIGSASTSARS